ncbi:MAG: uridine kinase [Bdellovibrionales bacterium]
MSPEVHLDQSAVVTIGIAGGSGSGKTTFARMIQANLSDQFCGWLAQDRYYRDNAVEMRGRVNYDHPDSLEFELLEQHLKALKRGDDILVPQYDFATHSRKLDQTLFPVRPVIIVDGILLLSQPQIHELLDFSYFIDTHEDIRFQRRLVRDVRARGRTPEGVREQFYTHVKPMHDAFVEPSRQFADRVISGERSFGPIIEEIVFGLRQPRQVTSSSQPIPEGFG